MPTRPILESENGIKIRLPIPVTETFRMRYFIHVSGNGKTFEDETGTVLPDALAARLHASVIAAELAEGSDDYHGFHVLAVDEVGNEIARMPVAVPS
jgi:hypothetical protein